MRVRTKEIRGREENCTEKRGSEEFSYTFVHRKQRKEENQKLNAEISLKVELSRA